MAMFTAAVVMAAGLAAVATPALAQTKEDKSAKAKPAKDLPAVPSAPAPKPVLDTPTAGNFANSAPRLEGGPPVGTGPKAADSKFDPARSVLIDAETTPTKAVYLIRVGPRRRS